MQVSFLTQLTNLDSVVLENLISEIPCAVGKVTFVNSLPVDAEMLSYKDYPLETKQFYLGATAADS